MILERWRFGNRVPVIVVLAVVGAVCASSAASGEQLELLLGYPGQASWGGNEVPHQWIPGVQKYWTGTEFVADECEGCVRQFGHYAVYDGVAGDSRRIFVPIGMWVNIDAYGPDSVDPMLQAIGVYMVEQLRVEGEYRVRLGIGLGGNQPDSYFPDDYYTVATGESSVGKLKSRY